MDFLTVKWNNGGSRRARDPHYISRKCVHVFILGCTRHVLDYCTLPPTRQVDNRNVFLNGY